MKKINNLFQLFKILNDGYTDEDVHSFVATILAMDMKNNVSPHDSMNSLKLRVQGMAGRIVDECIVNMNLNTNQINAESTNIDDYLIHKLQELEIKKATWFHVGQVSKIFDCSNEIVHEMCKNGKIEYQQRGEHGRMIHIDEVKRYLAVYMMI